jgi:hypothetical protein
MRWTWVFRLAIVGAAYSASLVGWLSLPGDRPVPTIVWTTAFVGMFPVWGAALLGSRKRWPRPSAAAADLFAAVKRPTNIAVGILIILITLVVLVLVLTYVGQSTAMPPGQPEIVDGQHVLNNHGAVTPISREEYLRYSEAGQRGFVGMALLFYLGAALIVAMTADRLRWSKAARRQ